MWAELPQRTAWSTSLAVAARAAGRPRGQGQDTREATQPATQRSPTPPLQRLSGPDQHRSRTFCGDGHILQRQCPTGGYGAFEMWLMCLRNLNFNFM